MNLLSDILTYMRRILKTPTNAELTDNLLIDYVNRFWMMDVDARIQPFDFKQKYQFQTVPGIDRYNMPLYDVQTEPGSQSVASFPVYQGFMGPAYINGVEVPFFTEKSEFYRIYPNIVQNLNIVGTGDGSSGPYTLTLPISLSNSTPDNVPIQSILRGHVDITGIMATGTNVDPPLASSFLTTIPTTSVDSRVFITSIDGNGASVVVADSGQLLDPDQDYGLLMVPGKAPFGNTALPGGYSTSLNTINYKTGAITINFPVAIPSGTNINAQCYFFNAGLPRAILFNNNALTLRSPPDRQYKVEMDAYLTPAAMLSTSAAIPFGYMAEYVARGAARKILSDTGDVEQFEFYEQFFKEQEALVWKRSLRQKTSTRVQTIYSAGAGNNQGFNTYPYGGTY